MTATITCFIVSLVIALWVGSYTDGIIGLIVFCVIFFPALKFVIPVDVAYNVYNNHHSRNDERAKKVMDSQRYIEQERHKNTMEEQQDLFDKFFKILRGKQLP